MVIAKPDVIEGLVKGLAVLESFDTERQRLNATLAAQRTGITRTAARRHLLTLAHLGYLETDGRYFWLTAKVLQFSGSYLASARLPRAVQPTLNRLTAQTQASFSVAVLDGDAVVIVARSVAASHALDQGPLAALEPALQPSLRPLALGMHLGARLPAHATSTGRVLLAALSRPALTAWLKGRTLPRLTPHTLTDPKALRAALQQVQAQDFALASEEHEIGLQALAVPLRSATGQTVAALNVMVSARTVPPEALQRHWLHLLQAAAQELRPLL